MARCGFSKKQTLIHPDQAKAKKAIPVPLDEIAINIIRKQIGKNTEYIFTDGSHFPYTLQECSERNSG